MASDHATLIRKLRKQGFTVEKRRGHLRVFREGGRFVVMPATPSDSYAGYKNRLRDLKTIGFDPDA